MIALAHEGTLLDASRVVYAHAPSDDEAAEVMAHVMDWRAFDRGWLAIPNGRKREIHPAE